MTLSTLPLSQAVKTPRVSSCEPLCARFGAGVACVARRGDILPARGKFRDGIKTTNTPPSPLRVQRFNGTKRTPRVVIPPPTRKCRKCKTGVLSSPPTGLPPKPSEAVSVGRGRATERASPAACGGTKDSSSARTTASIAFVWSAAKPLPCQMHWVGHGPTPPSCGQKPTPTFSYDWRKT